MDTLRNYRNTVQLSFEKHGDGFTLKVPHYGKWISIISYLRKRGFIIGENLTYKEHYKCLSKYHKIGFKKDVACLMEISGASISVEFGNTRNLWKEMAQSFWSNPSDDRFSKLSYLENLAVKLEVKKLMEFSKKYKLESILEDSNLPPEEYIINTLKENTHIHGKVECLNDIKLSIAEDSYDYNHNSDDKNKKKIICGETKYFYDYYTKRLSCGVVWHHINNMWWVICSGKLRNIVCWDLFDFDKTLPRREEIDERGINSLLKKYEKEKNYKRCHEIQKNNKLILEAA